MARPVAQPVARPSERPLRVCCIGAGAAGLSCAKEMLQRGFETTVLESREGVGGVWRMDASGSHVGVRQNQRATSSKYYLGFSDFPIADAAPEFIGHELYLGYLDAYADYFGVTDRIRFGHRTEAVRRAATGEWEVDVVSKGGRETLVFDALAICTGLHHTPHRLEAEAERPSAFKAKLVHARELKDADATLSGQRIVVVGGGETGAEIAHVAAQVGAPPAVMSLRRGVTVIGTYMPLPLSDRMPDSRSPPVDLNERRVVSLLPPRLKHLIFTRDGVFALREENPGKHTVTRLVVSVTGSLASLILVPFSIVGGVFSEVVAAVSCPDFWRLDKTPFRVPDGSALSDEMSRVMGRVRCVPPPRLERDTSQLLEYTLRATEFRLRGFTAQHYRDVRSLLEEFSGALHSANFLTKSDDFIYDILDKSLEVRPGIKCFEGERTVRFEDGSSVEADVVVSCTGYDPQVPFLSELLRGAATSTDSGKSAAAAADGGHFMDGAGLYKNVFHPQLGGTVAFVGFARPQLGAMPPIAELQGRWFGAVLAGEATLPEPDAMATELARDAEVYDSKVFARRMRSSVNFAHYTTDIASRAGCLPAVGLSTLLSDPLLWQAFWLGPVLPQCYRLADAGAVGEEARARVKAVYQTFFSRA